MKIRYTLFLFLTLLISQPCFSQANNLIPNYSFENVSAIPTCLDQLNLTGNWSSPNIGTPDLISCLAPDIEPSSCSQHYSANCAYCEIDATSARTGNNFLALWVINYPNGNRESATTPLASAMIPGQTYYIEYYVIPSAGTGYIPPAMFFTTFPFNDGANILLEPQFYKDSLVYQQYDDDGNIAWVKVSGTYTADQAYSYVTIGNFFAMTDPRSLLNAIDLNDTFEFEEGFVMDDIRILPITKPQLGPDQNICDNDSATLNANVSAISYIWSTGDTTASITVHQAGSYWVGAMEYNGVYAYDTIEINTLASPKFYLGPDTGICSSHPISIPVEASDGIVYSWDPGGQATAGITIDTFGTYTVTVENAAGCENSASITVYDDCPHCLSHMALNPNPVYDNVSLSFISEYDYHGTEWTIMNDVGQICKRGRMEIATGPNDILLLNNASLPGGLYFLTLYIPCENVRLKFTHVN